MRSALGQASRAPRDRRRNPQLGVLGPPTRSERLKLWHPGPDRTERTSRVGGPSMPRSLTLGSRPVLHSRDLPPGTGSPRPPRGRSPSFAHSGPGHVVRLPRRRSRRRGSRALRVIVGPADSPRRSGAGGRWGRRALGVPTLSSSRHPDWVRATMLMYAMWAKYSPLVTRRRASAFSADAMSGPIRPAATRASAAPRSTQLGSMKPGASVST